MKKIVFSLLLISIFILNCTHTSTKEISVAEVQDKIYASWLGQIIGNIYGLPHENAYIQQPGPEEFPYGYGKNAERLKNINGAFSDDDTDFEYMYLLAMEKYGPEPTYHQLAESWLYHVRDRVWLANRAALGAMHFGYTPPVTGMQLYNPHWFQIDPQLVNEIWAVTAPGMVKYAAAKSDWAARITNDGWGVEPTVHYGAMYAAAFFESDINKLIDIGVNAMPPNSRFALTVKEMKALYKKYPDDWRAARKEMADKYYHHEPENTKTIWNANLNGACGILALLYGQGDFQKTLDLSCAIGFDADNQAATMCGLLGIISGTKGLPTELLFPFEDVDWELPFNDFYKNVSRFDMPDASLKDMANRMAQQADQIILQHGGKKVTKNDGDYYVINTRAQFIPPLEFPNAPTPYIEIGQPVNYAFILSGASESLHWSLISGDLPAGLIFSNGRLTGTPEESGLFPVTIKVQFGDRELTHNYVLIARDRNMAPEAVKILSNVKETNTAVRDSMWLSVAPSLYSNQVSVINDGIRFGDESVFYSIDDTHAPKIDYYGYEWNDLQNIGLIGFNTGSMEENGGWFTDLIVQYIDEQGNWKPVQNLKIIPELLDDDKPFNKAHFVEYLLAFEPVTTKSIRIIGNAGNAPHWFSRPSYFTSISELTVHSALPGFEKL